MTAMTIEWAIRKIRHHLGSGGQYWDGEKVTGCSCADCRWHRSMARKIEKNLLRMIQEEQP
jgi:hypothetical protein